MTFTARCAFLATIAILGACHQGRPTSSTSAAGSVPEIDDGMIDVGGESLHVHCVGSGAPLVLIDGCFGCDGPVWSEVQPGIGRFTRACVYDRAGSGYSDTARARRSVQQVVDQLRALIATARWSLPIVLVGQGLGGLDAQLYASEHPGDVAGLVLVDSQTADQGVRYWGAFPPQALQALQDDLRGSSEDQGIDLDSELRGMMQLQGAQRSLGNRPLVVLNRGKAPPPRPGMSAEVADQLEHAWQATQVELAQLSSNAVHIVVDRAGWIPTDAPELAVSAVRGVVSSVRTGNPVDKVSIERADATADDAKQPASTPAGGPLWDGMADIGGRRLHVHCMGSGEPTVVMEAGAGQSGATWRRVQPEIAKLTRACAYDRGGLGFSDRPPKPRAVADVLQDLHALLATASISGPYVLVGHSIGGLYVRLYAAEHPDGVAGMVLVDGSTEDQDQRLWSLSSPDELKMMDEDPEGIRLDGMRAAMAQLRGANRSIGDKPLVVLTAGVDIPMPGTSPEMSARQARIWQEMQAELPQRISSNSTQIVAAKSHHFIQMENPKLVVASIRQVVEAVRTHGHVDGSALAPLANEPPVPW